jgi:quinol monooxygenase YgiN
MFSFQAYTDREALYSTHFNSPAMKTFLKAAMPHMATDLDLSFWTHVAGFIDADDKLGKDWEEREERECGVMYDVKIICKNGMRVVVKERLVRLAEGMEDDGSKGVLTWMVFEGLDHETDLRIFGRYVDRDSMEALRAREEMVEFWRGSKGEIERIEQRGYVPNGKGWLHR